MQILALADKSPATVQFSRLRTLAERKRERWAFWHFERTKVTDHQDESACYYYCAKCCGPVWIEEPFQNLIFVGLISCGSSGSAGLWMGWCCSLLSTSHSCFQLGSLLTSLSHAGLLQGQECESLWWHYGWMESSRVIMSQRNTIHSNQKVRSLLHPYWTSFKLFMTM